MADDKMLSQQEIDALLTQSNEGESPPPADETGISNEQGTPSAGGNEEEVKEAPERIVESRVREPEPELLSPAEKDALGEIGNISMGSASTTLSELLQQRVNITSPRIRVTTQEELFAAFEVPFIIIQVQFKEGLDGFNILFMQLKDAMVMANLMMGGDGTQISEEISEMEVSAASEAMNQMIGTASTSLATMFSRNINISPPKTEVLQNQDQKDYRLPMEEPITVVSFRMTVGELLDTEIMQVMGLETARKEASLLWEGLYGTGESESGEPVEDNEEQPFPEESTPRETRPPTKVPPPGSNGRRPAEMGIDEERLAMLMDIPLRATVVLGRTKKPIKEVLHYTPGAIVELSALVEEPVEILVNGVPVARGEVVVVNENFGVRITDILTPAERVQRLTE